MATKQQQEKDINELKSDVLLLKRDFSMIDKYFESMDQTVKKIEALTGTMTTMISLHEERIKAADESDKELELLLENRRLETRADFDKLEKKFDTVIDKLREDFKKEFDTHRSKIGKLTIFRASIVAVVSLLAFVASALLSSFFNAYFQTFLHKFAH